MGGEAGRRVPSQTLGASPPMPSTIHNGEPMALSAPWRPPPQSLWLRGV